MMRPLLPTLVMAALAVGCTIPFAGPTATATAVEVAASTTPPPAVPTVPPIAPTVTGEPASTPFMAFTVMTSVDNALLRENPGYLFPQVAVLKQGSALLVMGRSPGGEWLFCQTEDHRGGWVFAQLVAGGTGDVQEAPVIWPASTQVIVGMVRDQAGVPISGIQFSIVQGSGNTAPRNDAVTDASGLFHAFMPGDSTGSWTVSYTAVSCTSNTMDAACNCIGGRCGTADPLTATIQLPRLPQEVLQFIWK